MNKKAFEMGQLVIIIITIVGFIVTAAAVSRAKADDSSAEVMCHDSIALRASTVININTKDQGDIDLIQGRIKAIPPLCKTVDVKMEGKR